MLRRAFEGIWVGLPALLVGGVAVSLGALIAASIGRGLTPASLLLGAVLLGPPAAATAATASELILHGEAGVGFWWRAFRKCGLAGAGVLLVPALFGSLSLVAFLWLQRVGDLVALASAIACAVVTAFSLAVALAALAARAARPLLSGMVLLITASHLVARWPVRFAAPLCLLCLGVWTCLSVTGTLLPLVPGPVLLLAAAAFWSSAVDSGATDIEDERTARS